jgi:hypothetical protein
MTREKFERIQVKLGYTVTRQGGNTVLTYEDDKEVYTAVHFWSIDGSAIIAPPVVTLTRK